MTPGARHRGFRPKKSLGQNFLTDTRVAQRIAESAGIQKGDLVIEIGPGKGALTRFLIQRGRNVVGIELDRGLCDLLSNRFGSAEGFHILNANALEVDFGAIARQHHHAGALVVGNLPYNIATPLILRLAGGGGFGIRKVVVMVQREVALRIVANPGSRDYGSLSIAVQICATPRRLFDVKPDAFRPAPRVRSTLLDIDLSQPAYTLSPSIKGTFFQVVRWTFGQRRKMLRGTLRSLPGHPLGPSQLEAIASRSGIDLQRRPETMSIAEFENLSRAVQEVS